MSMAAPVENSSIHKIILAACVISAASISVTSASTYILDPMAQDFGLEGDDATMLKYIPTLATIVVVFLAGVLGDRIGRRRAVTLGAAAFLFGALITCVSPTAPVAIFGMSILGAGASTMMVLSLAAVAASVNGKADRAKAFGTLGAVAPFAYMVIPIMAGYLATLDMWRGVPAMWILFGVASLVLSRRMLPRDPGRSDAGELITPIIAGIVLVLATQVLNFISEDGLLATRTLITIGLLIVFTIALILVYRRLSNPTMSFAPLHHRVSLLLLVVTLIIALTALWYTTYLAFEYLFGLTPLQIAFIMIPAQLAGMAGAKAIPHVIIRKGLRWAGMVTITALGVSQLLFLSVNESSLWLMALLMCFFALAVTALGVVLSNAIMNSASQDEAGGMAAYRAAFARVGAALASLLMGILVLGTYNASLDSQATQAGLDTSQVDSIATSLAQNPDDPQAIPASTEEVAEISDMQATAMVDALRTKALFGAGICVISAIFMAYALRNPEKEPDEDLPQTSTSSA